jgi:hypothetical protein
VKQPRKAPTKKTARPPPKVVAKWGYLWIGYEKGLMVVLPLSDIIGFQAWREDELHTIEYSMRGPRDVTTEYEEESHWVAVLQRLEAIFKRRAKRRVQERKKAT